MKNILFCITALTIVLMSSCSSNSFETTPSGLEYRFIKLNKDNKTGDVEHIYSINMLACASNGDTLINQFLMFERYHPVYPGDFHEALGMLHEGDSAVFKVNADSFFYYHPGMGDIRGEEHAGDTILNMHIGVKSIMSPIDHFVHMSELELNKMNEFVQRKRWNVDTDSSGIMYEITVHQPENDLVELGDSVKITYMYYLLNERILSKVKDGDFWKLEVGDPDIRVTGLSRILTFMREGERIRAILPFAEAFGEDGMPPSVPPYSSIVMEIEVLELTKHGEE